MVIFSIMFNIGNSKLPIMCTILVIRFSTHNNKPTLVPIFLWQELWLNCLDLVKVNALLSCFGHMLWRQLQLPFGLPTSCG